MKIDKAVRLCVFIFFVCKVGFVFEVSGQRYWDVNGSSTGSSSGTTAVGTWGVNNFWSTSANGTSSTTGWTSGQQAIFSAGTNAIGTYTITLSGNQIVSGLVFQEGNVTLSGGRLTLTTGVGNATIDVNSGWKATIASQIDGTAGLIKIGAGMLVLSSSNTYSGVTDLRAGTLVVANDYALGNSTLNLGGGAVAAQNFSGFMRGPVTLSASSTITGSENITFGNTFTQQGGNWTLTVNNTAQTTFSGSTFNLAENNQSRILNLNVTGGDVTINGVVRNGTGSGADGLIKSGSGTLVLNGNNTFTGNLEVDAGTVAFGNNGAAGLGQLILENGATVAALNGPRVIANDLVINGNVTFKGPDSLTFSDSFKLEGDRTFTVENTTIFTGVITGGRASLFKKGSGTLVFTGDNRFGVPPTVLSVDDGTFAFGSDNAAGRDSNQLLLNGGSVQAWGGARTIANPLIIQADSGISGNYNITFTGTADNEGGSHTLTVNNTGLTTFAGAPLTINDASTPATLTFNVAGTSGGLNMVSAIQNGTGTGSLVKSGAGTMTLNAASTYTGGTVVNGGTLMVRNTSGSATGTGVLTINNGGTLAGNGTILGPIVLNSGGRIAPGVNGIGTLNTAGETWNGGSMISLQMNDVNSGAGIGWDLLNINGPLTINASSNNPILIDLSSLSLGGSPAPVGDFTNGLDFSWRIATASGGINFSSGTAASDFNVVLNNFQNDIGAGYFDLTVSGNNLMLNFHSVAVPEPSVGALATLGFLILIARFRMGNRSGDAPSRASRVAPPVPAAQPRRNELNDGLGLNGFISRC